LTTSPIITVRNVGKKYRIGKVEKKADTMMELIIRGLKQPFANLHDIRNLTRFEKDDDSVFWALKDISFDVHEGEVLGIIGHNGAGKSTLLKILSQITEPTNGEIWINGRVAALLEVGTGFHQELTGRENIYMNGTILGMPKKEIDRKLEEIINFSGVEQYIDTPVKFYSSGMRVRLGFSVAAHLEPEILVIDEVLAVGDLEFQKKCIGKIEKVSKTAGRTVLFVSHNMHAISELCNRVVLLEHGVIAFTGPVSEAINKYAFSNEEKSNRWIAKEETGPDLKAFKEINCVLRGQQPHLNLDLFFLVNHNDSRHDCFVAFDLLNSLGDAVMQALPTQDKVVRKENGSAFKCSIILTGLIPGTYYISCWMGSHNNETDSYIEKAVSFSIAESPTHGRTYPHTLDHGNIVPISSLQPMRLEEFVGLSAQENSRQ
jgi:lipopolysaccharide transport system ATP-binding protein